MTKKSHLELMDLLEGLNQLERDYYILKGELLEAELKLAVKKAELIKERKITGRNDMFREAQIVEFAKCEYLEVKQLQKKLLELQSIFYPLKREWEVMRDIVLERRP